MTQRTYLKKFIEASRRVGAEVVELADLQEAAGYIASQSSGRTLVPQTLLAEKYDLRKMLGDAGVEVFAGPFRQAGHVPAAGG
ncbi:MAG: hypothetical protein ABR512_04285, partial [Desulfopila sp.]